MTPEAHSAPARFDIPLALRVALSILPAYILYRCLPVLYLSAPRLFHSGRPMRRPILMWMFSIGIPATAAIVATALLLFAWRGFHRERP